MTITKPTNLATTVLALLNGMFGGSIMVLPLLALKVGWFYLCLIIVVTVIVNWYSCHIVLLHLGNQKDVGSVITNHFKKSKLIITAYNLTTTLGLLTALTVYFKLIVIQIQGLFLDGARYELNSIINGVVLALWCFLTKILDIDTHISGYGFFSIAAYFVFLLWVALSASTGTSYIANDGTQIAGFTAVMSNALTIQFIFVPILKSYTNRAKYSMIMVTTFIFALVFYFYINAVGAYGIANRPYVKQAETIQSFFSEGEWQVKLIQSIYLLHLYSVFPQYLLAGKKRFYSMLGRTEQPANKISSFEAAFIFAVLFLAVLLSLLNINVRYIIQFNGAVFGFIYCYLIPVILHIKCAYFPYAKINYDNSIQYSKSPIQLKKSTKEGDIIDENMGNNVKVSVNQENGQTNIELQSSQEEKEYMHTHGVCYYVRPRLWKQIAELFLLALMMAVATYVLIYGLLQIFK